MLSILLLSQLTVSRKCGLVPFHASQGLPRLVGGNNFYRQFFCAVELLDFSICPDIALSRCCGLINALLMIAIRKLIAVKPGNNDPSCLNSLKILIFKVVLPDWTVCL